jgi:RNA polymerase sigma factor (sigma-70 family)
VITEEIRVDFVSGKKYAYDVIYTSYSPGMFAICLRYTRCEDDAKDVLQEAFIKVFVNREQYDPTLSIGAWIKTITIHTALTYIKKNYRFVLHDDELVFDELVTESAAEPDIELLRRRLLSILNKLPDGYRTVFNLYTIDNLTHKEIASYLGISESTSKTQYLKARKMIQQLLETEKIEE